MYPGARRQVGSKQDTATGPEEKQTPKYYKSKERKKNKNDQPNTSALT